MMGNVIRAAREYPMLPPYKVRIVALLLSEAVDYGHKLMNIPGAWLQTRGEGIKVGVADTGKPEHRDVAGQVIAAKSFVNGESPIDKQGHSTHVCGIIAGIDNDEGIVGAAPDCSLVTAKVLSDSGAGSDTSIARGLAWLGDQGCHLINASLGAEIPESMWRLAFPETMQVVADLHRAGVAIFAAAGNAGADKVGFPAGMRETIAVAAVDSDKQRAAFSNRGSRLDFAAPGVNVLSTYLNQTVAQLSGTSMASPYGAAIGALILSHHALAPSTATPRGTPINGVEDLREHVLKMCFDSDQPWNEEGAGIPLWGHVREVVEQPPPPPPNGCQPSWASRFWDAVERILRRRR